MDWEKTGVNYWENPDCPRDYLQQALIGLIDFVEGEELPANYFDDKSRDWLAERVGFYEDVADK